MQNTTYTGVLFAPRRHGAHAHSYDGSGQYDDDGGRCRDDEVEGLEYELDGLLVGQVEGREESTVDGGVGVWVEEGARVVLGDEDTAEGEAGAKRQGDHHGHVPAGGDDDDDDGGGGGGCGSGRHHHHHHHHHGHMPAGGYGRWW